MNPPSICLQRKKPRPSLSPHRKAAAKQGWNPALHPHPGLSLREFSKSLAYSFTPRFGPEKGPFWQSHLALCVCPPQRKHSEWNPLFPIMTYCSVLGESSDWYINLRLMSLPVGVMRDQTPASPSPAETNKQEVNPQRPQGTATQQVFHTKKKKIK